MKAYSLVVGGVGFVFGLLMIAVSASQLYQGAELSYRGAVVGCVDIVVSAWLIWRAKSSCVERRL